jgi:SAM-dependent methyltransferase
MGKSLDIMNRLHSKTARDYVARMTNDKVECMKVAKKYGQEYWDGDRRYGYGGYRYDGRWEAIARGLIEVYALPGNASILDVGCGKGYLLYEFKKLLPDSRVVGFDISQHALQDAKEEIKPFLKEYRAQDPYPFEDREFDLAISIMTLHNLPVFDLKSALIEMERVAKSKYVVMESFRNEQELFNLQCWALTCESFFSPEEWKWLFKEFGYTGDYEFLFFE